MHIKQGETFKHVLDHQIMLTRDRLRRKLKLEISVTFCVKQNGSLSEESTLADQFFYEIYGCVWYKENVFIKNK